jgi:hypothetical protein
MQPLKKIHIGKFLLLVVLLSFTITKAQHLISPPYFYYDGTNTIQGKMVNGLPNQYLTIDATGRNLKFIDALTATPFNLATTTNDAGSDKTASIWRSGRLGIGTNNPSRFLDVVNNNETYTGIIEAEGPVTSTFTRAMAIRMRRGTSATPTAILTNDISAFGFAGYDGSAFSSAAAAVAGIATEDWTSTKKGMALTFHTTVNGNNPITEKMRVDHNGNLGIGTNNPTSRLEVNGSATNTASHNAGTSATIDFSQSNLAYTNVDLASGGTTIFNLNGIKDGGTYTLRVRSITSGTANFQAISSGFTLAVFKSPNNGLTAANSDTLYTFMVIRDRVFFYMTTGL